jgi:hypothetical protein
MSQYWNQSHFPFEEFKILILDPATACCLRRSNMAYCGCDWSNASNTMVAPDNIFRTVFAFGIGGFLSIAAQILNTSFATLEHCVSEPLTDLYFW